MKKILCSAVALASLAFAGPTLAADLIPLKAPPPVIGWSWTGTYIGVVGGGGWGTTDQFDLAGTTTGNYRQSGGVVGGTSGIQIQYGRWVFGAESDLEWSGIKGSVASGVCAAGTCFTNLRWLETDRTRIGLAWGRYMLYATGGVAFGSIRAGQDSCATPAGSFGICGTHTNVGWTAGVGGEAFIAPKWSVKLEYLHVDLGTNNYSYTPVIPVSVKERADLIRVGLNYYFDWPH